MALLDEFYDPKTGQKIDNTGKPATQQAPLDMGDPSGVVETAVHTEGGAQQDFGNYGPGENRPAGHGRVNTAYTQTGGTDPATGGPDPIPPIWEPIGTEEEMMDFDTTPGSVAGTPDTPYYQGEDFEEGILTERDDAQATTREVQDNELVATQMSNLLNSDSKFMQDARRQGLEQANAFGGLGGTAGAMASMQAAMRSALPIATADAQAFRDAAKGNMDALNQFAMLNAQRSTQMDLANLDARTKMETTRIGTSAQLAQAKLQDAMQRDLSMLDAETKLRVTEMGGKIQERMADAQFKYSALLADQQGAIDAQLTGMKGEYGLADTGLGGYYNLENTKLQAKVERERIAAQREASYTSAVAGAFDSYTGAMSALNGIEMDDAARSRAIATIERNYRAQINLINTMYPEQPPLEF
jgi:hypothetical protein